MDESLRRLSLHSHGDVHVEDEHRLAELGYRQELKRNWSLVHNFGVSFSIIVSVDILLSFGMKSKISQKSHVSPLNFMYPSARIGHIFNAFCVSIISPRYKLIWLPCDVDAVHLMRTKSPS